MIVINIFGIPQSEKFTCATYVYSNLKIKQINVKLISNKKVNELQNGTLKCPELVFGELLYEFSQAATEGYDFVVTDTSLILPSIYSNFVALSQEFEKIVYNAYDTYPNKNYFIHCGNSYTYNSNVTNEEYLFNTLNQKAINCNYIDEIEERYIQIIQEVQSLNNNFFTLKSQ